MATSFSLSCGAFPSDVTEVIAFKGRERVGTPYEFDIWLTVQLNPMEDAPWHKFTDVVGAKARLILTQGEEETSFGGLIAEVERFPGHAGGDGIFTIYRIKLVPALWQLNLTRHTRMFTNMSVTDVMKQVLDDEGITEYEIIDNSQSVEEHIFQYQESSLAFLHRWMEREGFCYFFEQSEDGEKLIITKGLPVARLQRHRLNYGVDAGSVGISTFSAKQGLVPVQVRVRDYDYQNPALVIDATGKLRDPGHGEVSHANGRAFDGDQARSLAGRHAKALNADAESVTMSGCVIGVSPGHHVILAEEGAHAFSPGGFVVTAVEYTGIVNVRWSAVLPFPPPDSDDLQPTYSVVITAIDERTPFVLPQRTPWPRIHGYESGVVDGEASSEYAQIDDHGRYLVRLKSDESALKDGKASTFVRMMQPHAGAPEGWHFPLRKGTEVTLIFLGGDPDRPVIAGAIPNAITPSPVTSANNTRNVIQTGGRNRFELEDLDGQQRITLSTPHANTTLLMGYAFEGHELIAKTDARGLWKTGAESDFLITGFWNIDVGKYKKEHVVGAVTETFDSTKTETVTDLVTETYNKGQKTTVNAAKHELTNSAGYKVTTTAGHEETVTGGHKLEVTGLTDWKSNTAAKWDVTGAFDLTVNGKTTVTSAEKEEKVWGATHENKLGAVSELYGGLKHETVIGLTIDNKIGIHLDTMIGGKVETCIGPKLNIAFLHNEFDLCWSHTNPLSVAVKASDHEITALKNRANAMETRQNGMNHRMSGMSTRMNGLQSQINGLRNSTAGVHVVS